MSPEKVLRPWPANVRSMENQEAATTTTGFKSTCWLRIKKLLRQGQLGSRPCRACGGDSGDALPSASDIREISIWIRGLLLRRACKRQPSLTVPSRRNRSSRRKVAPASFPPSVYQKNARWRKDEERWTCRQLAKNCPPASSRTGREDPGDGTLWWANARRTIRMSQQVLHWCWAAARGQGATWHLWCCFQFSQTLGPWILLCKPFPVPSPLHVPFAATHLVISTHFTGEETEANVDEVFSIMWFCWC